MSIGADLATMIKNTAAITAMIGSGSSCRFEPIKAPLNTSTPYCAYQQISPGRKYTHQGFGGQKATYQISCFHTTPDGAAALSSAVIAALESWSTAKVKSVFIDEERWLEDEETKFFHVAVTFTVTYEE